ncbi:hypothetical protein [Niallia sp. Krafla_26]|uniref:hypothetical protein n=1 Tax=Niallia sp. Krafla_26 TaxID=3064703 RepID=UPI003D1805DE
MRLFFKRETSNVCEDPFSLTINGYSKTVRLVFGALLGSIAVILQSAGVFTGVGFIFSMMSTGPLVLSSLLSLRIGVMTYFVTAFLLAVIQPSELLIFLFTTGLLGVSLGFGLKYLRRSVLIVLFAAFCLTLGITLLLYGFKFPILGPSVETQFNGFVIVGTFFFSFFYSWIWKEISLYGGKYLHKLFDR